MQKFIKIIVSLVGLGLVIFLLCAVISSMVDSVSEDNKAREIIGRKIVINNDTLVIINYKYGNVYDNEAGFILSNGIIADKNLVFKNLIDE